VGYDNLQTQIKGGFGRVGKRVVLLAFHSHFLPMCVLGKGGQGGKGCHVGQMDAMLFRVTHLVEDKLLLTLKYELRFPITSLKGGGVNKKCSATRWTNLYYIALSIC